jgi:hypothetical protein
VKLKKLNARGFSHDILLVLFVVIFAIAGVAYLVASHASTATPTFTYLALDQPASVQPTAWGKTIQTLVPWNGKIYAGYGDYNTNTGPIAINPFVPFDPNDPNSKTFANPPEAQPCDTSVYRATGAGCDLTEEVDTFRIINGKLYAPSVDPQSVSNSSLSTDYAVGSLVNGVPSWQQVGPADTLKGIGFEHAYDMATLTGSDLWEVGSQVNGVNSAGVASGDAVAYRSLDGGTTWAKMLDVLPTGPNAEIRFFMAGVYNGKLYLQPTDFDYGVLSYSEVFDGTSWSKGPQFLGYGGYHPQTFAGKMVYLGGSGGQPLASSLYAFDGSKSNAVGPTSFYDYAIDNTTVTNGTVTPTLYALGYNDVVYSTIDLTNWYQQTTAPTTSVSIGVLKGQIYVGTTDSKIYSAPVNTAPTLVNGSVKLPHANGKGGHVPK